MQFEIISDNTNTSNQYKSHESITSLLSANNKRVSQYITDFADRQMNKNLLISINSCIT